MFFCTASRDWMGGLAGEGLVGYLSSKDSDAGKSGAR